jgi:hypothetical protein
LKKNAKILASLARVELMLNAELPSIELYVFATQAMWVIHIEFAKNLVVRVIKSVH